MVTQKPMRRSNRTRKQFPAHLALVPAHNTHAYPALWHLGPQKIRQWPGLFNMPTQVSFESKGKSATNYTPTANKDKVIPGELCGGAPFEILCLLAHCHCSFFSSQPCQQVIPTTTNLAATQVLFRHTPEGESGTSKEGDTEGESGTSSEDCKALSNLYLL